MPHRSALRRLAPLAVLPLALAGIAGCGDDDDDETVGPEEDADVEDVGEDEDVVEDGYYDDDNLGDLGNDELVGETVTVSAEIDRVIEDGLSFVVGEEVVDGGLLVLTPPDLDTSGVTVEEGADVQVEGEVIELSVPEVEGDYEPFVIDDDLYTDYENENAVVAQSITDAPPENGPDDNGGGDSTSTTAESTTTTTGS